MDCIITPALAIAQFFIERLFRMTHNVIEVETFFHFKESSPVPAYDNHSIVSREGVKMMKEDEQSFLPPGAKDSISQLSVEERIQQLIQEFEGLVEHSQLLKQHRQRLVKEFDAQLQKSRALHKDLQKHIMYLSSRQEALRAYREKLQMYLDDH